MSATTTEDHALETNVFTVLVGIITVLCIVLNAMGIYVFLRLPRTPSNLVYLHLCITDLIVGIFVTPYSIVILMQDLKVKNEVYCILQGIMFEISYMTTLFILTYISLDRLLALYQPLKYKELMSARAVFWINIGTWVVPVIRPIIRYIMRVFGHKLESQHELKRNQYGYDNDEYLMVCYNTDYINFVKMKLDEDGIASFLPMIDMCVVVVACQLATLISSILVVARLSHRLHLKRTNKNSENGAKRQSTLRKSTKGPGGTDMTSISGKSSVRRGGVRHFHPSPDDNSGAGDLSVTVRDDEKTAGNDMDDSLDSGQNTKKVGRKKREAERHAIITMVTVIVFFMVTYTPSFVCFIVPGIYEKAKEKNQLWIFLLVDYCTFINSTFLPMVHFSRSAGFKRQLKSIKSKIIRTLRLTGPKKTVAISDSRRAVTMRTVGRSEYNGDIMSGGSVNDELDGTKSKNNLLNNNNNNHFRVDKLVPKVVTPVTL